VSRRIYFKLEIPHASRLRSEGDRGRQHEFGAVFRERAHHTFEMSVVADGYARPHEAGFENGEEGE